MCVLVFSIILVMIIISAGRNVNSAGDGYVPTFEEVRIMSKKIVVITGSPRKKGNSFAMTEAFIKAAEKKGIQ